MTMRLGGPVPGAHRDPEAWAAAHRTRGYSAAYAPEIGAGAEYQAADYTAAAAKAGLVIAEVGAWSNPLSRDEKSRLEAVRYCKERLALADELGAKCCVNIAGSVGEQWDGPHEDNLTEETFALIVDTVREIIDAVKPVRTCYTLETMPYLYPDSIESYERLLKAIDRKAFAVHFDPVNLINSPQLYYRNGEMIREFVRKLGPHIRSCHAKDIILAPRLTVHLDETRPGLGGLDFRVLLAELERTDPDMPIMLEHLSREEEYREAAEFVVQIGKEVGIAWR